MITEYWPTISSGIGLLLDIGGVYILFEYGLPSKLKEDPNDFLRYGGETEDEKQNRLRFNEKVKRMANRGLWFLIAGFFFQFVGTVGSVL